VTLSRYQLERTDLLTEIEQGRKVEIAQFQESHRTLRTMGELLWQRNFNQQQDVRFWERHNAYVKQDHDCVHLVEHGAECPCDGCTETVLHMAWDIIGLPRKASMGRGVKR